jgi:phosphoglycolate phosphatase-like HAD superfamily hydrolase
MIKLIIFDWDDVFTQGSTEGYYKCYHEAVVGVGVHLEPEVEKQRIGAKWGADHREEIAELLKEHPELVDNACELYEEHLFGDTFVDCLSVLPGSQELLSRLSKKYKLAVASGVHPKLLKERIMGKFNIPEVFSEIITAYDLDDPLKAKPHPHIAEEIMRRQNIATSETIMVGDAKNDVLMARNAGIEPVVVLTGHLSRQEADDLKVQNIIENVTRLETVLDKF